MTHVALVAMHLLGCYLEGTAPDLRKLTALFEELEKLNEAFARRLKRAIQNDAGINALVVLHARNMVASFSVEEKLDEIRGWYRPGPANHP